jgi:U3 small nucleolar ribonucleoprotein protein LCP5
MRKGHVIFGMVEHLVSKDLPIFFDLLKEFQATVEDVTKLIKGVETRILNGTLDTKKGISLLDVKYHLLLGYLIDLSQYILLKTEGKSIHGSVPITGLVETRVVR